MLLSVYAAGAVTLGTAVPAITGRTSNELVVALATLAVAALFQPTRRRIQRVVDRRFNGAHYDAARTIERFGQRLRNEPDPDTLLTEIRRVIDTSVQPMTTSIWMSAPAEGHSIVTRARTTKVDMPQVAP